MPCIRVSGGDRHTGSPLPGCQKSIASGLAVVCLAHPCKGHPGPAPFRPDLPLRGSQRIALLEDAGAQRIGLRILHGAGIQRAATGLAERQIALPLAVVLAKVRGTPLVSLKPAAGAEILALKAEPECVWQSRQWQTVMLPGCTSASNSMAPHRHRPSTFMRILFSNAVAVALIRRSGLGMAQALQSSPSPQVRQVRGPQSPECPGCRIEQHEERQPRPCTSDPLPHTGPGRPLPASSGH